MQKQFSAFEQTFLAARYLTNLFHYAASFEKPILTLTGVNLNKVVLVSAYDIYNDCNNSMFTFFIREDDFHKAGEFAIGLGKSDFKCFPPITPSEKFFSGDKSPRGSGHAFFYELPEERPAVDFLVDVPLYTCPLDKSNDYSTVAHVRIVGLPQDEYEELHRVSFPTKSWGLNFRLECLISLIGNENREYLTPDLIKGKELRVTDIDHDNPTRSFTSHVGEDGRFVIEVDLAGPQFFSKS